ncbi:MAG: hypothetical protein ACR2QO_19195, partial [Acidimicrobiales bacterium]
PRPTVSVGPPRVEAQQPMETIDLALKPLHLNKAVPTDSAAEIRPPLDHPLPGVALSQPAIEVSSVRPLAGQVETLQVL